MKRFLLALALVAGLAWAGIPTVKRDMITPIEASFKDRLITLQMEILALPRGLYVEGVGTVFIADVSLAYAPMINPFQLTISKEVHDRNHVLKLKQLPLLRDEMRQMLLNSSAALETMPAGELIVLGVTIGHQNWESTVDIPSQIVMQGQRSKLLEARLGKTSADSAIRVQEQ